MSVSANMGVRGAGGQPCKLLLPCAMDYLILIPQKIFFHRH